MTELTREEVEAELTTRLKDKLGAQRLDDPRAKEIIYKLTLSVVLEMSREAKYKEYFDRLFRPKPEYSISCRSGDDPYTLVTDITLTGSLADQYRRNT